MAVLRLLAPPRRVGRRPGAWSCDHHHRRPRTLMPRPGSDPPYMSTDVHVRLRPRHEHLTFIYYTLHFVLYTVKLTLSGVRSGRRMRMQILRSSFFPARGRTGTGLGLYLISTQEMGRRMLYATAGSDTITVVSSQRSPSGTYLWRRRDGPASGIRSSTRGSVHSCRRSTSRMPFHLSMMVLDFHPRFTLLQVSLDSSAHIQSCLGICTVAENILCA
jgi:hypothetical protein